MWGRIEPPIGQVSDFAGEIELRYQTVEPALDGQVDVWRAGVAFLRRIGARFDRSKTVAAGRVRCDPREPFEIGIERRGIGVAWMAIFSRSVRLPDIDACARHRLSRTGEHASADIDELALRFSGTAGWTRKISRQIGAIGDWVERSEDLRRRARKHSGVAATRRNFGSVLAHQGNLISASLMTFAQWATSVRTPSPNSAAVPPTGTAPIFSSNVRVLGSARTLLIALLSCEVTSAGVPRLPAKPIQSATTRSGNPASTTEGTSLRAGIRVGAVTASARSLPVAMRSMTGSVVTNMYWTFPLIRSAIAWENCWYGTWVARTPACNANISPIRCDGVPKPADEKLNCPGLLLRSSTSSGSELTGKEDVVTSTV